MSGQSIVVHFNSQYGAAKQVWEQNLQGLSNGFVVSLKTFVLKKSAKNCVDGRVLPQYYMSVSTSGFEGASIRMFFCTLNQIGGNTEGKLRR